MKKSITKDEINELPMYICSNKIILIEDIKKAKELVKDIQKQSILGFDTETRAAFKKGESYPISLLQLATQDTVYLFRLNKFPLFDELKAILAAKDIIKAGVAIRDDINGLKKINHFEPQGFVELAQLAKENQIEQFGLRALTALLLNKRLSKRAKVSNWAKNKLTEEQIQYAACDAAVGREIYLKLNS